MNKLQKIKNKLINLNSKENKEVLSNEQFRVITAKQIENTPKSALFYTTHKCASTFMQKLLIKLSAEGDYTLNDYASAIWSLGNKLDINQDKKNYLQHFLEKNYDRLFYLKGEIYGPLRFPIDFPNRKAFQHLFFLRDPRDVIVSSYYSFGFTHALPPNSKGEKNLLKVREEIQQKSIDQYAIDFSDELVQRYNGFKNLRENCDSYIYLKYDDFTSNTKQFILNLTNYLNISLTNNDIELLCKEASPVQKNIQKENHKRSGKSGQFMNELQPETVLILNKKFKETLLYWEFKN
jgi:hypothetical protein